MKRIEERTSIRRCAFFAASLALVITSGSLGFAQRSEVWAIDQVQRAVRERMTSREGERDLSVRFAGDERTETRSNANLRVHGTGRVARSHDGKSRRFSYEADVDARNSSVSDIHYDWRGGWYQPVADRLTGTYRLDSERSDDAGKTADRVTDDVPRGDRERLRRAIVRRLEAPESLEIERDGRTVTMASSQAGQVTFEADGREQIEQSRNGRSMRTSATLSGDRLIVTTDGDRSVDYQVTFEPVDNGRSLRVTRRVTHEDLRLPVVAKSVYRKTSDAPQFDVSRPRDTRTGADSPAGRFLVPDETEVVAVLHDRLSTKQARDGDRFTLSVRSPSRYAASTIEGHLVRVARSGQVAGRAEMSFDFDSIATRDGRRYDFAGSIESVRTSNDDAVRVDSEGRIEDEGSQTERTVGRAGIGAAIGAVIGAVTAGGKGAAIGAAVGAGAGAGSVFVQGRDDLELTDGTEFQIRARTR
jgi:hypothetical protein